MVYLYGGVHKIAKEEGQAQPLFLVVRENSILKTEIIEISRKGVIIQKS